MRNWVFFRLSNYLELKYTFKSVTQHGLDQLYFFNHGFTLVMLDITENVSGLPTSTIPHHVDIGPDEWFYSLVMVLVGSRPS